LQRMAGNSAVSCLLGGDKRSGNDSGLAATIQPALEEESRPLDPPARSEMESRFGRSFDDVRIHTGSTAASSTAELGANAYTVGSDVVFGAGRYDPRGFEGRRVLAHELAHVVQNRLSGRGFAPDIGASSPSDHSEREATEVADAVLRGDQAPSISGIGQG